MSTTKIKVSNIASVTGTGNVVLSASPTFTGTTATANVSYTGTLTGSTGILNIGSGQLCKDASGNVGIGTSSPGAILHTSKTSVAAATVGAFIQNSDNTVGTEVRLGFAANTNLLSQDRYGWIGYLNTGGTNGGALTFATTPGGTPATERMRIDASGNVGIGVTPPSSNLFGSLYGPNSFLIGSGGPNFHIISNGYYNSGYKYAASGEATWYKQQTGQHVWYNAPSGTAGNAITFTQAMTLDASGNVGIGTSSPAARLHAYGSTTNASIIRTELGGGADGVYFEIKGGVNYRSLTASTSAGAIDWAVGQYGTATGQNLAFYTGTTERMRITSTGGVSFGSSGTAYGTSGQVLSSAGNAPPTWINQSSITSGSCSGNAATATTATNQSGGTVNATTGAFSGSLTTNSFLRVGNGLGASDIYMADNDEGERRIHCNSNRVGFLTQAGGWGAWCEDDGSWGSAGTISGTNITTGGNVTGSSTSCTGNAATATTLSGGTVTSYGNSSFNFSHGQNLKIGLPAANNGAGTGNAYLYLWTSEPAATWTGGGIARNMANTNGSFPRVNTNLWGQFIHFEEGGAISFQIENTSGTRYYPLTLTNGDVFMNSGNLMIGTTSSVNTNTKIYAVTAGQDDNNGIIQAYNTNSAGGNSASLMTRSHWGTGQFMSWSSSGMRIGMRSVVNGGSAAVYYTYANDNIGFGNNSALGTGALYTNGGLLTNTNPSDARLKTDIQDITLGLDFISQLKPVSYKWLNNRANQDTQYGFIAQDVQEIEPSLVREFEAAVDIDSENSDDRKTVTRLGLEEKGIYTAMVKAIQELKAIIDTQQEQINIQQQQINTLLGE